MSEHAELVESQAVGEHSASGHQGFGKALEWRGDIKLLPFWGVPPRQLGAHLG